MDKHTPGPWRAERTPYTGRASAAFYIVPEKGSRRAVAHVKHSTVQPMQANAQLLAAAPELLEALEGLLEAADSMRGTYGVIYGKAPVHEDLFIHDRWAEGFLSERADAARAAMAKATGEN